MSALVPMNDLARRWSPFEDAILEATRDFVRQGRAILGAQLEAFETEFARYCGTVHCAGVANGTDALEVALRAIGVREGDRVATVANAGGYTTSAIRSLGGAPAYVDVDPRTLNMDPAALERALARQGVRAVVLTHLYGRMADVEAVSEICERYRVPWIEDCAQAHGASLDGRRAGSWGRAAAFSFYPTKNLGALGDGGAVVTSDPAIDRAVRELRQYGWSERYRATRPGGRNSRLDELQAAVLRRFLPELDRWNAERRSIATRYLRALGRSGVVPPDPGGDEMVWHLFVVRANDREGFRGALRERGIGTDVHYPIADHRQPAGMVDVSLPRTELACDTVVSLPLFPELREEEIARVCRALEEVTVE